jgi:hypothetical protein
MRLKHQQTIDLGAAGETVMRLIRGEQATCDDLCDGCVKLTDEVGYLTPCRVTFHYYVGSTRVSYCQKCLAMIEGLVSYGGHCAIKTLERVPVDYGNPLAAFRRTDS